MAISASPGAALGLGLANSRRSGPLPRSPELLGQPLRLPRGPALRSAAATRRGSARGDPGMCGGVAAPPRASRDGKERVRLRLRVAHQVQFGERVAVLGSAKWLGRWRDPVELRWSEDGWSVELEAGAGEEAEFKFVVCGDGTGVQTWEDGPNRKLRVPHGAAQLVAEARWSKPQDLNFEVVEAASESSPSSSDSESEDVGPTIDESSEFAQRWQGKQVRFMRSNEHSGERQGTWDTSGLQGPALALVQGDRGAGAWWRKLELVEGILTPLSLENRTEALVYCSIYLQWINTGQIPCSEDGGHRRPNRAAEISRSIFRWMERDAMQQALTASRQGFLVLRKVHPRLPAFTSEFTASVPLTRIRDIAHRNDIPHELKQEIKHTIQNKLHRNAGPEDLIATELLLQRVTKPGTNYSPAFIEQLRIFYRELKDFFNAGSLTEQLEAIRPSLDEGAAQMLGSFLAAKQEVDNLPAPGPEETGSVDAGALDKVLAALHSLTGLRAALLYHLNSGLRNDAPDEAVAMRQKWRLSEIGLEDYAFVLLSRVVNEAERRGGSGTMSQEAEAGSPRLFDACVGACVLALRHLGLSGWEQAECLCLEQELAAWQAAGVGQRGAGGTKSPEDVRWWALRFKATLDRALRLAQGYTQAALDLYSDPAQRLGKALGIEENAVRTYAEAEIRASVVFQLSKLVTLLLRTLRTVLRSEGWDVLMPGCAAGRLVHVERIDPALLQRATEDTVLLVDRADGDEEVKAAGDKVRGVILLQELPHLSHLAVRARQEKVPFVTCEDEGWVQRLKEAAQRKAFVGLDASADGVRLDVDAAGISNGTATSTPSTRPSQNGTASTSAAPASPLVSQTSKEVYVPLVPLADADLATCGAKAVSCARLLNLSTASLSSDEAFLAPQGAVIPFGMLDDALRAAGAYPTYLELLEATESAPVEDLDQACALLRDVISGLSLPLATMRLLGSVFPDSTRLIVRSSANVEDLAGMSGAGLYESIPNVRLSDPSSFSKAVAAVWASLYSRRAVLSRRAAGVRQADAAMAVLVQELVSPHLSFVLHTKSLVDSSSAQVHMEIAPGLGETLASGTRGSAWRLAVHKDTDEVKVASFANFSEQLVVVGQGVRGHGDGSVAKTPVDYTKQQLSVSREKLNQLAVRLSRVGQLLERTMGSAQDIEGCVIDSNVVVVQSRPQP